MKKLLILLGIGCLLSGNLFAGDIGQTNKGQKYLLKSLKDPCGMKGGELAKKHTQFEWKKYWEDKTLNEELIKICPKAKEAVESDRFQKKYKNHILQFLYDYASDSGNVPSC